MTKKFAPGGKSKGVPIKWDKTTMQGIIWGEGTENIQFWKWEAWEKAYETVK